MTMTMIMVIRTTIVMSATRARVDSTGIKDIHMPAIHTAAAMSIIIPHPTATAGCSLQPSS